MKKIFKYFVLLITLFSSFIFSSCSNNYAEVEVPVSNYQIINDGGSFGTTVIQFYVSEEFEYDLDLLKDIKIKFSYRPENALVDKTVTEVGKVDDFVGADDSYFYVNIKNRVATYIDDPIEVKSVSAKIEKRFVEDTNDDKPGEKYQSFGIGAAFILGLISSSVSFGCVYLGSFSLDETKGKVVYGLGFLIPIIFSIITFVWVGIVQGIIISIFSLVEIIGAITYMLKR